MTCYLASTGLRKAGRAQRIVLESFEMPSESIYRAWSAWRKRNESGEVFRKHKGKLAREAVALVKEQAKL